MRHHPPHLRDVTTLPWEIKKNQIFCRYSTDMEENANSFLSPLNFVIHPQILVCSVFKIASFPHTGCKKIHVTVLLIVYFCGQFVAPEIRHTRRYCSVCQQSTWYLVTRTTF